jgi:hypothetical protein
MIIESCLNICILLTTLPKSTLEEYYCRLSSFGNGMCVYQCQNGFERFTWVEFEKQSGCKLMKKVYKA